MRVAPSILAADFANLESELKNVDIEDVDLIHIDVMDGHFVPNISLGPDIVSSLRPLTKSTLDVHLMIEKPERYVKAFADAGADAISVHAEACPHLHRVIEQIKTEEKLAGVALNPGTSLEQIKYVLPNLDFLLIMTVNPGFGGQSFIQSMVDKIREARAMIDAEGYNIPIEVDGGINKETIKICHAAGAEWFVAGSAIFKQDNRELAIKQLLDVQ